MIGLVRAAALCATLALGLVSVQAADKAFKRDDLGDSAIKLEAQIKSEAGPVAKSAASLRTDADAAFRRAQQDVARCKGALRWDPEQHFGRVVGFLGLDSSRQRVP